MAFIVLGQQDFLRFQPHDSTGTIVACFISAVVPSLSTQIFVLFMVAMIFLRRKQETSNIQRENYVELGEDRERKYSEVKGIPMTEYSKYRE